MSAWNSAAHCRSRGPPDSTNRVEKGGIIRLLESSGIGLATIPPASHSFLELDFALGRLHVLENPVDYLLDVDALGLCGKIRKHAVTQHGARDANDIRRRYGEAPREKCACFCAEYEVLARARTRTPAHVFLYSVRRIWFCRTCRACESRSESQCWISSRNV